MTSLSRIAVYLALLGALTLGGCKNCALTRVPAIDQTGERILVPNGSTAVVSPVPPNFHAPVPAYTTPPQPPACGAAPSKSWCSYCSIFGHHKTTVPNLPGAEPRLVLSPARVVAPVGTEVVLAAGVANLAGKTSTGQPMEWMLSQDSVGTIVATGDQPGTWCAKTLHGSVTPKKVTGNYVVGRTSATEQLLDRGTPSKADDVLLPAGQSWLTITSAVEGVSNVTAYAPDDLSWEKRQQTAQVYWIDAQWVFPPPAISRAGQKVGLVTNVMRHQTPAPIPGWSVVYEIAGGVPAGFDAQGTQAVEVPTDVNGNAPLEVLPQTTQSGVTQIRVQVVRPAAANGSLPRLVVGTGYTSVTWSAPGLAVRVSGPEMLDIAGAGSYRVEVTNPGDLVTRGVTLTDELPAGLTFVSATPQPQVFGNRLEWGLGDLNPRANVTLQVNVRADRAGDLRHCVRARTADGLSAEGCTNTRVQASAMSIEMEGPPTATVGQQAQFRMKITNRTNQVLKNVLITDRFDAGLRHPESASPIERSLGELGPGETKAIAVTFMVVGSGQLCHTVTVTADGGYLATQQACVSAVAGIAPPFATRPETQPGVGPAASAPLQVEVTGAQQRRQGEKALFNMKLTNNGGTPLRNVRAALVTSTSLTPSRSLPALSRDQAGLAWVFPEISAGGSASAQVECDCTATDPNAFLRVTVQADGGATAQQSAALNIVDANPAPGAASDASRPATGKLTIDISDLGDPVKVGSRFSYAITVKNDRADSDKRVALRLTVPPAIKIDRIDSRTLQQRPGAQAGTIEFDPIAEMRPGETFTLRLDVTAQQPPGKHKLVVEASSLREFQPVVAEEETTVFAE